jgi:hypothetical protein
MNQDDEKHGDDESLAETTNTLQRAQVAVQPAWSSLGLVKNGYKHWVARSGTLVANMIMGAGTLLHSCI